MSGSPERNIYYNLGVIMQPPGGICCEGFNVTTRPMDFSCMKINCIFKWIMMRGRNRSVND